MERSYEQQAQDFLTRFGLKCRITLSDSKPAPWGDDKGTRHHYRVTISRPAAKPTQRAFDVLIGGKVVDTLFYSVNSTDTADDVRRSLVGRGEAPADCQVRESRQRDTRLVFDFWGSIADAEKGEHPTAYDVLSCISGDAYTPDTFADFCADYGYDSDSIKALQCFRRADRFARRLRAFFSPAEIDALSEIQ